MTHPTLSIILPTYNESHSIVNVINAIHRACSHLSHEIIVVDDHSPDGTAQIVQKTFAKARWAQCFLHPGKQGLGLSILYGIKQSRGRIIIGMDSDGNHDPKVIPLLLTKLKNADLVVASRFIKGGGMHEPTRYYLSLWFNYLLRFVFKFPITDNTSGFYAIRRKTLEKLNPPSIYYDYGEYHLRLVWATFVLGLTLKEIPVYYGKRTGGISKSKLFPMMVSYIREAVRLKDLS